MSFFRRFPLLALLTGRRARILALAVLAVAAALGVAGGTWDAAWHVTLRRETFWSPPHLLLYAGTSLALVGALFGLLKAPSPRLTHFDPGFALAALGALVVIGSAPLDDFWHRTFGADVDVWSFPHLVALAGGAGINVGAAMAIRADGSRHPGGPTPLHRAALLLFLTALLWVAMFSLNWYTLVLARVRDSVEYPALAALVAPPVLVLAHALLGRWGATTVAALYMGYTAAAHWVLAGLGYALLPFPPVLLLPAVAIDLLSGGSAWRSGRRAILAGLAFGPLFYLAEAASLAWYPHPALPPPRSDIAAEYFAAALARPWNLQFVSMGLPLVLLTGAGTGWLGARVAAWAERRSR